MASPILSIENIQSEMRSFEFETQTLTKGQDYDQVVPFVTHEDDFDVEPGIEVLPITSSTVSFEYRGTVLTTCATSYLEFDSSKIRVTAIRHWHRSFEPASVSVSIPAGRHPNPDKAFIVVTHQSAGTTPDKTNHAATFSAPVGGVSQEVIIHRWSSAANNNYVTLYIVEALNDEFTVQRGTIELADGVNTNTLNITSVDMNRTMVLGNMTGEPRDTGSSFYRRYYFASTYLDNATTIRARRVGANSDSTGTSLVLMYVQAVEWSADVVASVQRFEVSDNDDTDPQDYVIPNPIREDWCFIHSPSFQGIGDSLVSNIGLGGHVAMYPHSNGGNGIIDRIRIERDMASQLNTTTINNFIEVIAFRTDNPVSGSTSFAFSTTANIGAKLRADGTSTIGMSASAEISATASISGTSTVGVSSNAEIGAIASIQASTSLGLGFDALLIGEGQLVGNTPLNIASNSELTATGILQSAATLSFANTGTISATGSLLTSDTIQLNTTSDLKGTGALQGDEVLSINADNIPLDATGALLGVATQIVSGIADIEATGSLGATTQVESAAVASIKATGILATNTPLVISSNPVINARGDLSTSLSTSLSGQGYLEGTGLVAATTIFENQGNAVLTGKGAVNGTTALSVIPNTEIRAIAYMTSIPADISFSIQDANLEQREQIGAAVTIQLGDNAIITATGTIAGLSIGATFSSSSTLNARVAIGSSVLTQFSVAGTMQAVGSATASSTLTLTAAAELTGINRQAGSAEITLSDVVYLEGTGAVGSTTIIDGIPTGTLSGRTSLVTDTNVNFDTQAILTGRGDISATSVVEFDSLADFSTRRPIASASDVVFGGLAQGITYNSITGSINLTLTNNPYIIGRSDTESNTSFNVNTNGVVQATGSLSGTSNIFTTGEAIPVSDVKRFAFLQGLADNDNITLTTTSR